VSFVITRLSPDGVALVDEAELKHENYVTSLA